MYLKYRVGNLELRSCNKHLLYDGPHVKLEISYYYSDTNCYTIGVFENPGYWDFRFIGIRPLDPGVDWYSFKYLIKMGYKFLEKVELDKLS